MRKKIPFIGFLYLFFLLVVFRCQNEKIPHIEIVAKVGDYTLTRSELFHWMPPNLPEDQKEVVARKYINRWIRNTVLSLSAREEGIDLTPYEEWTIENLRREMLANKYLESKLPREIIVTEEEISNYYEENKDEFVRNEDEVHLVQLFLENLDKAIASEIRKSKSLLEVIQKNYLDAQMSRLMERNGDLGYVPIGNLRKRIARLVKTGRTGKIYGPISLESGYYYFQMMDKQPRGSYRSLDLVRDDIRMRLLIIKRDELTEKISKELIPKYSVETYPEHIK